MLIKEREMTRQRRLAEEENNRQAEHLAKFVFLSRQPRSINFLRMVGKEVKEIVVLNGKQYDVIAKININDVYRFTSNSSTF